MCYAKFLIWKVFDMDISVGRKMYEYRNWPEVSIEDELASRSLRDSCTPLHSEVIHLDLANSACSYKF